ncbi:DUF6760 family protein [Streptomyces sp. NPDC001339]|uniref:DUF6760 family protein n=1 Tax=Streptomyces sp. NPDC001339 TaxID=3364563 RepID=UPI0036A1204D
MTHPVDRLYEELTYLGYYLHWSPDALLDLDHRERLRYVHEVARLNTRINDGGG